MHVIYITMPGEDKIALVRSESHKSASELSDAQTSNDKPLIFVIISTYLSNATRCSIVT